MIGLGIIGRRLVQLLEPFRCQIQAHDPYVPKEVADVLGVRLTNLDAIMAESDVIVCVAPITPATRRMVGARELGLIQPGSALVNVSRGPIFDPDATIARLARGDITGAFDVWDPEPIPADSRIRQLPNVFLTPHVSSQTKDGRGRFFTLMVDELDRFFHGHETLYDLTSRTLANRFGRPARSANAHSEVGLPLASETVAAYSSTKSGPSITERLIDDPDVWCCTAATQRALTVSAPFARSISDRNALASASDGKAPTWLAVSMSHTSYVVVIFCL